MSAAALSGCQTSSCCEAAGGRPRRTRRRPRAGAEQGRGAASMASQRWLGQSSCVGAMDLRLDLRRSVETSHVLVGLRNGFCGRLIARTPS